MVDGTDIWMVASKRGGYIAPLAICLMQESVQGLRDLGPLDIRAENQVQALCPPKL